MIMEMKMGDINYRDYLGHLDVPFSSIAALLSKFNNAYIPYVYGV